MIRRRWLIGGVLAAALGLILGVGGAYALSLRALELSQREWCPVLALVQLEPHPTAQQRRGYAEVARLRAEFGCGG